jgi:D-glycero-D-manno-heptose 1,7-bisphosphate phosphatase
MHTKAAVFFDRDDTLIEDVPYLGDPARVKLMPECRESLRALHEAGFVLFIASNQSGVGRGLITREQVAAVNAEVLRQTGDVPFGGVYCCYDDPDKPQEGCRKPSPAMLLRARDEHGLDLARSFMVGDRLRDVQAGRNAGCRTAYYSLVRHADDVAAATALADFTSPSLVEIARWILRTATPSPRL